MKWPDRVVICCLIYFVNEHRYPRRCKTWGGLVGIWDTLISLTVEASQLHGGYYNLDGEWDVEDKGVVPDVNVEMNPADV